jgi:hypothetical protein
MKKLFASLVLCGFIASAGAAQAETTPTTAPANAQTNKMKTCAAEYQSRNLPKGEYRRFMSACLKKDYVAGSYVSAGVPRGVRPSPSAPVGIQLPATASTATATPTKAPMSQREKMKECNVSAAASNLKGPDRAAFMKTCLSGAAAQ